MNGNRTSNPRPVFLHGMWRSGSTYIWSRFRALEDTYCYYEPLNHGLGRLTKERIKRDTPDMVQANAHPTLSLPYFAEYEPLLKRRGVRNFSPSFSYSRFALDENEHHEPLRRHISSLINHAVTNGKIPVLGFNASDLRVGWMANNFNPVSIHINRDPADLWRSYQKFALQGNYTFFGAWLNIIEQNRFHPVFAPLAKKINLRSGFQGLFQKPKDFYRKTLQQMKPEETYGIVFYLWLSSTLHALGCSQYVIDIDRAAEDNYVPALEKDIAGLCGLAISFADLKTPGTTGKLPFEAASVENEIMKIFPFGDRFLNWAATAGSAELLSFRKRNLLDRILN